MRTATNGHRGRDSHGIGAPDEGNGGERAEVDTHLLAMASNLLAETKVLFWVMSAVMVNYYECPKR